MFCFPFVLLILPVGSPPEVHGPVVLTATRTVAGLLAVRPRPREGLQDEHMHCDPAPAGTVAEADVEVVILVRGALQHRAAAQPAVTEHPVDGLHPAVAGHLVSGPAGDVPPPLTRHAGRPRSC